MILENGTDRLVKKFRTMLEAVQYVEDFGIVIASRPNRKPWP